MFFRIFILFLTSFLSESIFSNTTISSTSSQSTSQIYEESGSPYSVSYQMKESDLNGTGYPKGLYIELNNKGTQPGGPTPLIHYFIQPTGNGSTEIKKLSKIRQQFFSLKEKEHNPRKFRKLIEKDFPNAVLKSNSTHAFAKPIRYPLPNQPLQVYSTLICPEGQDYCNYCIHSKTTKEKSCSQRYTKTHENSQLRRKLYNSIRNQQITFQQLPPNGQFTLSGILNKDQPQKPKTCEDHSQKIRQLEAQLTALKQKNCAQTSTKQSTQSAATN